MKTVFTRKLFIFGGAYGNFEATKAILHKADTMGFASNEILFTGDSVAYCGSPEETAQLIKNANIYALEGNCEEAIASGADDCGCGFEEGTECDILSDQWYRFCKNNVSQETINWMSQLPDQLVFDINGFKMLAVHATPQSNNQFIFPSTLSPDLLKHHKQAEIDGYISGHSGIPFIGKIGKALWINSGASGMPANDGTPRIWYATIENQGKTISFQTHALEYDHHKSAMTMKENNLDNGYMECLTTGIWPSHDVLPAHEKSETGIAITPQKKAQSLAPYVCV